MVNLTIFYRQFTYVNTLNHVLVAYYDGQPIGCGAMQEYDNQTVEMKRLFVHLTIRGKGIAPELLKNLELWAKELGYKSCILETGDKMPEEIGLYKKCNYERIPSYGQYENIDSSVCFKRIL